MGLLSCYKDVPQVPCDCAVSPGTVLLRDMGKVMGRALASLLLICPEGMEMYWCLNHQIQGQ